MYIKIYNRDASKRNMLEKLKQITAIDQVVSLGESEQIGDKRISGEDANQIVKNFKKAYEPYVWKISLIRK